jgi:hypothetical protein
LIEVEFPLSESLIGLDAAAEKAGLNAPADEGANDDAPESGRGRYPLRDRIGIGHGVSNVYDKGYYHIRKRAVNGAGAWIFLGGKFHLNRYDVLAGKSKVRETATNKRRNRLTLQPYAHTSERMDAFKQCLDGLSALESSPDPNLDAQIDALVIPYLAGFGFGAQTAAMRDSLADAFAEKARMTEIRERIMARIRWEAQPQK